MGARFLWFVVSAAVLAAAEPPATSGPDGRPMGSGPLDLVGAVAQQHEERNARQKSPPAEARPNPLHSFLGEWMTPKDYVLLKPGLLANGPATSPAPGAIGPAISMALPGATRPDPMPAKPAENPYLELLGDPPPAVAVNPPSAAPNANPPAQPPASIVSQPAPLPPKPAPQSKIPDFVKPATDNKYFKPLKRF